MAQIIKIGHNWYSDFRQDGKRIRRVLSPYKEKAQDLLDDLLRLRQSDKNGTQPEAISWYFFEEKYLKYRKVEFAPNTYNKDVLAFAMLKRYGRPLLRLAQMTPEYLVDLGLRAKAKGMSERTVSGHLRQIKTAMHIAESWGYVPSQSWKRVKTLPDGKRVEYFSYAQLQKVLSLCKGSWKTAGMLMAYAGLRAGEVRHLEWSDIDFADRLIHIRIKDGWRPKGSRGQNLKERAVDLSPKLESYLKALPRRSGYVLGDEVVLGHTFTRYFARLKKKAGTKVFPHKFRHTYASYLISSGSTLDEVGELLGHTDRRSTQVYAHMMPHARRTAVDRMQAWMDQQTPAPLEVVA